MAKDRTKHSTLAQGENLVRLGALIVGESARTIEVDASKLPAPPTSYDADFAWVEHSIGRVSFFFGKGRRGNTTLRSRVEVKYPVEDLVRRFWKNAQEFRKTLADYCERWPKDPARDGLRPESMVAEKEHSEWANVDYMAHAGSEAAIDFYHVPPGGVARFAKGLGYSALDLSPVLRIQLSSFELRRLLDQVESIVAEAAKYVPATETDEAESQR